MILKRLYPLIVLLLGIGGIVLGCYLLFFENRGYKETTAVIQQIDKTYIGTDEDGDSEYDYDVYVKYTVGDKEYDHRLLNYYQSGYKKGKNIRIYYNPKNPEDIHGDGGIFGFICLGVGVVMVIASGIMILRRGLI